jgi:hypothetical protein
MQKWIQYRGVKTTIKAFFEVLKHKKESTDSLSGG